MRHSAGAWSGKTSEVPGFPNKPLAENTSRNPRSKRDALSQSRPYGKLQPAFEGKTGMQLPGGASKNKVAVE